MFKLDEVTASQRVAIYSQRRAFLTSSDEGIRDSFNRFCIATLEEIYDACLPSPKSKLPLGKSFHPLMTCLV